MLSPSLALVPELSQVVVLFLADVQLQLLLLSRRAVRSHAPLLSLLVLALVGLGSPPDPLLPPACQLSLADLLSILLLMAGVQDPFGLAPVEPLFLGDVFAVPLRAGLPPASLGSVEFSSGPTPGKYQCVPVLRGRALFVAQSSSVGLQVSVHPVDLSCQEAPHEIRKS